MPSTALSEFSVDPGRVLPPFRAVDQRPGYYLFFDVDDEKVRWLSGDYA